MIWIVISIVAVGGIGLWMSNLAKLNQDPAQQAIANEILDWAIQFDHEEMEEDELVMRITNALLVLDMKRRTHLASLLKVQAPAVLTPDKAAALYQIVASLGRSAHVTGFKNAY